MTAASGSRGGSSVSSVKRCVIVGATSGIGRALAQVFAEAGYEIGITGRRAELLASLAAELPTRCCTRCFDVCGDDAMAEMTELIAELGTVDVVVVNAGVGTPNRSLAWPPELATIDTNVVGFAAMCNVAWHQFTKQGHGHLVGISSILALRGGPNCAYNASKAFASSYLAGLRSRSKKYKHGIDVTDIKPGFVDTALAKGTLFWVATPDKAARQIFAAVEAKRKHAYITRRWRLIAWLLKLMPDGLYNRIN